MSRFTALFTIALLMVALCAAPWRAASAAGSVEMQVEHLVKEAMAEYNTAMETGDSACFLKYFAYNTTRETPLSRQSGRTELAPGRASRG